MTTTRYQIIKIEGGKVKGIICGECNALSWHPEDVENKYCGKCHTFHEGVNDEQAVGT